MHLREFSKCYILLFASCYFAAFYFYFYFHYGLLTAVNVIYLYNRIYINVKWGKNFDLFH